MHHGFVRIGPVFIVNGQSPDLFGMWTNLSVRQNPFQPREFVSHGFEHLFRPYAVMDVSRMDSH